MELSDIDLGQDREPASHPPRYLPLVGHIYAASDFGFSHASGVVYLLMYIAGADSCGFLTMDRSGYYTGTAEFPASKVECIRPIRAFDKFSRPLANSRPIGKKKEPKTTKLTQNEMEMLFHMARITEPECCTGFDALSKESGLPRQTVRRLVRSLARKGYAYFSSGLCDMSTGGFAGSGYGVTKPGYDLFFSSSQGVDTRW